MARRKSDLAAEVETPTPPARGSAKAAPSPDRRSRRKAAARPPAGGRQAAPAPDHVIGPLAGPIQLGEFTVDGAQLMIQWKGRASWFTPAEWRLLCVLLRNPGTVMSREELAAHAWDVADPDRRSTVDVYVSRIRRKLDPASGRSGGQGRTQLIQTVRHRGYRLVTDAAAAEAADASEDSATG